MSAIFITEPVKEVKMVTELGLQKRCLIATRQNGDNGYKQTMYGVVMDHH